MALERIHTYAGHSQPIGGIKAQEHNPCTGMDAVSSALLMVGGTLHLLCMSCVVLVCGRAHFNRCDFLNECCGLSGTDTVTSRCEAKPTLSTYCHFQHDGPLVVIIVDRLKCPRILTSKFSLLSSLVALMSHLPSNPASFAEARHSRDAREACHCKRRHPLYPVPAQGRDSALDGQACSSPPHLPDQIQEDEGCRHRESALQGRQV